MEEPEGSFLRSFWKYLNPNAVAGFAAGFVSSSVLYPLEVVKSRFQVGTHSSFTYKSSISALRSIYAAGGIQDLYRGFPAGLAGSSMSWGIYFWLYNNFKTSISQIRGASYSGAIDHWPSSILSSVVVQTLLCPLWVVKLNQQLGNSSGFWAALKALSDKEGIRGLYRGLVPGYWSSVHLAFQLVIYEELKKSSADSLVAGTIIATIGSKSIATLLTSPIEVVKTRLRSSQVSLEHNVRSISVEIWRREGFRGFYRGMGPALIRILPSQCLTFVTFETVRSILSS